MKQLTWDEVQLLLEEPVCPLCDEVSVGIRPRGSKLIFLCGEEGCDWSGISPDYDEQFGPIEGLEPDQESLDLEDWKKQHKRECSMVLKYLQSCGLAQPRDAGENVFEILIEHCKALWQLIQELKETGNEAIQDLNKAKSFLRELFSVPDFENGMCRYCGRDLIGDYCKNPGDGKTGCPSVIIREWLDSKEGS